MISLPLFRPIEVESDTLYFCPCFGQNQVIPISSDGYYDPLELQTSTFYRQNIFRLFLSIVVNPTEFHTAIKQSVNLPAKSGLTIYLTRPVRLGSDVRFVPIEDE